MRLFTSTVTGLYFNSKPWSTRSIKNEIITRAVQAFLPAKAKDFKIHFGYSKRKIMKLITVLIISLMFSSCVNKNLSDAENFFGDSLRDKVEYLDSDEKWNDFNGNGFRVDIYEIKDLNYFKDKSIDKILKLSILMKIITLLIIQIIVSTLKMVQVFIKLVGLKMKLKR